LDVSVFCGNFQIPPPIVEGNYMIDPTKKSEQAGKSKVYVWDIPLRLFHWALLAAVATSLFTAEFGPMSVHLISGHVVLGLLAFRLVWGFAGGRYARFANFVKGPGAVLAYARKLKSGVGAAHPGHNPMGGWSVLAMIAALAIQTVTGMYANDDILTEGPLADTVTKATSDYLTYIHHLSSNAVYALIVLHVAAVAFYTYKGQGIVAAMIDGRLRGADADGDEGAAKGSPVAALLIACAAGALAYYVMGL